MLDCRSRVAGVAAGLSDPWGRVLGPGLYPEDVILNQEGQQIVDWESAAPKPPEADAVLCWAVIRIFRMPGLPLRCRVRAAGRGPTLGARR